MSNEKVAVVEFDYYDDTNNFEQNARDYALGVLSHNGFLVDADPEVLSTYEGNHLVSVPVIFTDESQLDDLAEFAVVTEVFETRAQFDQKDGKYGVTWSTFEGGSCFQTGYVFSDIGEAAIAARNGPFAQEPGIQVDIFPGAELNAEWQMYGDVELNDDISGRVLTVFSVRYESSRSLCEERSCAVLWRFGDTPRCRIHDQI